MDALKKVYDVAHMSTTLYTLLLQSLKFLIHAKYEADFSLRCIESEVKSQLDGCSQCRI